MYRLTAKEAALARKICEGVRLDRAAGQLGVSYETARTHLRAIFEVIEGLREGETIVAGTYQAIRDLKDGAKVRAADTTKPREAKS